LTQEIVNNNSLLTQRLRVDTKSINQKSVMQTSSGSLGKRNQAGLKDLSLKVIEQVIKVGMTSYKDVALQLIERMVPNESISMEDS
jgi:hypothetical protein